MGEAETCRQSIALRKLREQNEINRQKTRMFKKHQILDDTIYLQARYLSDDPVQVSGIAKILMAK